MAPLVLGVVIRSGGSEEVQKRFAACTGQGRRHTLEAIQGQSLGGYRVTHAA